jgi:hypothetical protein
MQSFGVLHGAAGQLLQHRDIATGNTKTAVAFEAGSWRLQQISYNAGCAAPCPTEQSRQHDIVFRILF